MDQGIEKGDILELPVASEVDMAYRSGLHARLGNRLGNDRGRFRQDGQEPMLITRREVEGSGQDPAEEYGFFLALRLVEQFSKLRGRDEIPHELEERAIYNIRVLTVSPVATREHAYILESFLDLTAPSIVQSATEAIMTLKRRFPPSALEGLYEKSAWSSHAALAAPAHFRVAGGTRPLRLDMWSIRSIWRIQAYIRVLVPCVALRGQSFVQSAMEVIESLQRALLQQHVEGCKVPIVLYSSRQRTPPLLESPPDDRTPMIAGISSFKNVVAYIAWLDGDVAVVRFEHPQLGLVEREFERKAIPDGAEAGDQFELRMELDADGRVFGYAPSRQKLIKHEPEAWELLTEPAPPDDLDDPEQMRAYEAALDEYSAKWVALQTAAAQE